MGFILSSYIFRNLVILFIISEFLNRHVFVIGALNKDNVSDHVLPFYDSNNHISEDNHSHDDKYCDCNSQGPWQPLFKASQTDPDSLHESSNIESTNHNIHEHISSSSNDLHVSSNSVDRQPKKHNHMIHLHLIPHIYVPVVHPMAYPMPGVAKHPYTQNEGSIRPYENVDTNNLPSEPVDNRPEDHSHEHHDTYHEHHVSNTYQDTYQPTESPVHHDMDSSHESEELTQQTLPDYTNYPEAEESHQYQVHEEPNIDPYYATGSSTKSQLLPLSKNVANINNIFNKMRAKSKYVDRSHYNKKFIDFPIQTRRLRVMRPPPLGQKETWRTNMPLQMPHIQVYPTQSLFDFSSFASFFNLKPAFVRPPITRRSYNPIVVQPFSVKTKRTIPVKL